MGGVNKVILVGHLGKDPEVTNMRGGGKIVKFSLATSESWRDKQTGERREKTEWHRVAIFNESLGKVAEQYLKKGAQVYLEGKLQTSKWQDKDGNDRWNTDVVLDKFGAVLVMLGKSEGGGRRDDRDGEDEYSHNTGSHDNRSVPNDEEIPF